MSSNPQLTPTKAAVIGIPLDENSSYLRGAALAPAHIRAAFHCTSANYCTESSLDLNTCGGWRDAGDLVFTPESDAFAQIEGSLEPLLDDGLRVLSLGGDHSITYPILQAYSKRYPHLAILHLDAHPDLYDELDGNRNSHACPFARIMEAGLAERLVQVGIRTITPHQREQAQSLGVEVIDMQKWDPAQVFTFQQPLYVSLDMDVLDPAFAPGISHHEPGGLSTREVLRILQNLQAQIVGADIVELNPTRDVNGLTAMTAAKLFKELLGKLLEE